MFNSLLSSDVDGVNYIVVNLAIVYEPDNLRVSSGWAKDCCYVLIPIYAHIVYWYDNICTRVA